MENFIDNINSKRKFKVKGINVKPDYCMDVDNYNPGHDFSSIYKETKINHTINSDGFLSSIKFVETGNTQVSNFQNVEIYYFLYDNNLKLEYILCDNGMLSYVIKVQENKLYNLVLQLDKFKNTPY